MNDFIETHEKSDIEKLDKLWKGEEKVDILARDLMVEHQQG